MTSIRRRLLVWLSVGLLAGICLSAAASYISVADEASELFDGQLKHIALALPDEALLQSMQSPSEEGDIEAELGVALFDLQGGPGYRSLAAPDLGLQAEPGLRDVEHRGRWYRVYTRRAPTSFVQVTQPLDVRQGLAAGMAFNAVIPQLLLLPLLALLCWAIVGRGLRPLARVADAVAEQSPRSLAPLPTDTLPVEVAPLVLALNQLLDRLGEAMRAQREFIADAAHALRTPMTALQLQIQLAERCRDSATRDRSLAALRAGIQRISLLVGQLLDLARQEHGEEGFTLEAVDLAALLEQECTHHEPLAEAKGVVLRVKRNDPATVRGDEPSLRVLVANLLSNAVNYCPSAGTVCASLVRLPEQVLLEISDQGPGIPAEERKQVFNRFYRGARSEGAGSGLGLPIALSIARRLGGSIALLDRQPLPGLRVRVTLPKLSGGVLGPITSLPQTSGVSG